MRPQMIYKSAIDWWFWAVIGATFALIFGVSVPLIQQGESVALWTMGFTALVGLGLPLWLAFSTEYETSDTHLLVRSGPFRWSIERATIRDIQPYIFSTNSDWSLSSIIPVIPDIYKS